MMLAGHGLVAVTVVRVEVEALGRHLLMPRIFLLD